MRKLSPITLLMSIVVAMNFVLPTFSADKNVVVKSGETKQFSDSKGYNNNVKEAQIENAGTISIYNTEFRNNRLTTPNKKNRNYSAIYNNGGTINRISNTGFYGNYTYTNGGAISSVVGKILTISGIIDSDGEYKTFFKENQSSIGGAIWNNKSSSIESISTVLFEHNTAKSNGGAIYNTGTIGTIKNSLFKSNEAGQGDNSKSAGYGGAIYSTKNIVIDNTNFIDNKSSRNGGAIAMMGGNLTLSSYRAKESDAPNSMVFMDNLAGKDKNDLYFGGKNQTLNLFAKYEGDRIVLDGGISIVKNLNININKSATLTGSCGLGSIYINGDVGSDKARANLFIYGGTLSLSNYGTEAYKDTEDLSINTIWANKVSLYSDTKLGFDIYLSNDGEFDESAADQLKLNSVNGSGRFVLTENSFNVVEGILSEDFTSNLKLIDTKANISSRVIMYDKDGNSTKILYLYDDTNPKNPLYKVRLATNGSVIFSNPYYIDQSTNPLGYYINFPAINSKPTPCIGLGLNAPDWTLTKNVTINSWEDLPDDDKNLTPRNVLLADSLRIYGKNKTITAEDNLVGFVVDKNCEGDAKYLYAERTSFINFENAITNEGGKIDLSNVTFNNNGLVDANKNILTLRGGALTNTSGEMNVIGAKKSSKSIFFNNKAKEGGAIYNSGALTIDYTTFGGVTKNAGKKNEKTYLNSAIYGGAIYNYQNADSKLIINNTKFVANTAVDGGAIYNAYDKGTTLLENYVVYDGMVYDITNSKVVDQYFDGAYLEKGQIVYNGYVYNGATEIEKYIHPTTLADATEINKATFTYNKAENMGGAIYNVGNLTVIGSTFGGNKKSANVAGVAGAAVANLGEGVYTSRLSNYSYSTGSNGGAIYNSDNGVVHLEGGTFSRNVATYCGGVVFNDKDATLTLNGYTNPVNNNLVYLSMSNNSAIYGGAIYNKGTIRLQNNLQSLSGIYTSNKATYASQSIVYPVNSIIPGVKPSEMVQEQVEEYNKEQVNKLVSGNYDFIAKDVLPKAELINGKEVYYDYVAPKGGAIYNEGTILAENQVAFGDKIYNLDEISRVDEYTPEGSLGVDGVINPLVSTDLVRDNLVYDMSNAVRGEQFIPQTQLSDRQIIQYITKDPTRPEGWYSTEDSTTQYNNPQAGGWFVFDGAEYVKDYVVGTPLLPGMIVYDKKIYTGASYIADYEKGTPYDPDKQMVYNDYIYNYEIIGDFVERTTLGDDEFRWINSPEGDAVYRGELVEVGEYVDNIKDNQIVYDGYIYNDPIIIGEYKPQTILKPGEFVHDGVVYSGQAIDMGALTLGTQLKDNQMRVDNGIYEGVGYVGEYQSPTSLAPDQKVINGSVYSGITYVGNYIAGTPLKNGQIVYDGMIYSNAKYVAKYREGTPLGSDQIVVGDKGNGIIYDVKEGAIIRDNVDPTTVNQEELKANNQYLYGRTIYDLSKTESTGISYIAPIKPVEGSQQVVYNGIIYDLNGSYNTGVKYIKPSDYDSSKHIVINDVIYNIENAELVCEYNPGTKLGPNQRVINGKVYDFTNAKYIGQYVESNLPDAANGLVEYNGRIYDIKNLVTVGPYEIGTRLGPNQHVIDGIIYEFTDENKGEQYVPPTEVGENQVVIEGIIYDTTNAEYVKPFEEGTVLGENEYRIGDQVYKLENTDIFYVEPVLPDPEKQEVVIDGKIYSLADATERGEYIEGTVLGENEVLYEGKVYNIENAVKRQKYEFGTELAEDEIVYNGYVYSKVECKGTYVPGTELAEDEIVYNGYIYANAKPVGDYVNAKLNINQASFKSNTANVKVVLKDNNTYMDEVQMGRRYTQQITYYVGKGGAIYNSSKLPVNIWSSMFTSNNAARYGGAICNENKESDIYIENTEFKSNSAKSLVTTVKTYIVEKGAKITKKKQTIKENVGYGGAIYTAGNVYVNINPLFNNIVRTTNFQSNSAAYGGAIYALGEVRIGSDTKYTSNSAIFDGGAIYSLNNHDFDYGNNQKITEFDFNRMLGDDNYIYKHGADMKFDIDIVGTQNYTDSITGEVVKGAPVTFTKNSAKGSGGALYGNKISIQGATFTSNKASANGGAIYANSDIVVNPYAFTQDDIGSIPKSIFKSNTAKNGGAIYASSTSLIKNSEFTSNKASGGYGGAIYAGGDSLIVGSTFSKNSAAYGGALYVAPNTTSYVINSNFTGNSASKQGGAIYMDAGSKMYIMAYAGRDEIVDINISGNKAGGKNNSIFMAEGSTLYVCAVNYASTSRASITIDGVIGSENTNIYWRGYRGGVVNVKNVSNVSFSDKSTLEADSTNMGGIGASLSLVAENLVKACSFYLSGSTLRLDNGVRAVLRTKTFALADNTVSNTGIDICLKSADSDKIQAEEVIGEGTLNISTVNIISNSKSPVTIEVGKDSIVNSISTKRAESAEATYKLKSYYDENGLLRVVAYGQKAKPAAVAAPVAAQIGGYLTQINSYDQAFMNMDMNMLKTREERQAETLQNRYALSTAGYSDYNEESDISYNSKGLWNRPYATFERVNLNNGPKVSNIGYGNYFGGDADMKTLKNGWKRQFSAYIGYNGSVQDYNSQSIDQNGGTVGVTEVWYKNNFFTGLTLNAGANVAQASTDLGRENMPMFMTGIASKSGYNFEFKEGKFIVQPSILLSYSFIHTFSHDNGKGSHVGSSPLNAIQVAPGIKFIANLKNGWQPYLGVNMRWNIIDKTHFSLQDVNIPDMSIDPYVEYGIGLQRRWGERFTGFGQAMIRNGGRNGVMLSFGFKWLIGR